VIRYDIRGCGESAVPPHGSIWTADRLAADVLNLIDHLAIPRIHWAGFESGGVWGLVFAATYPERISSLTICNTPSASWIRGRMGEQVGQGTGKMSAAISQLGFREWLVQTNSGRLDLSIAPAHLVDWHVNEHSKTTKEVAIALTRALEELDPSGLPSKVNVPVLIMVGDRHTVMCPVDEQYALARAFPDARLAVFSGVGPGIQVLVPDRCTEEILRFLTDIEGRGDPGPVPGPRRASAAPSVHGS
jgi:pimeloyl-ACP methyl ester carboxylesterase